MEAAFVDETSGTGYYDRLAAGGDSSVPLYLITFDKRGLCTSPLALARLLDEVKRGVYTDVHVFSHGWNNVFKDAVRLYRDFFDHYFRLRTGKFQREAASVPVVVGVIWPSTLLVLPWEAGAQIAGGGPSGAGRDDARSDEEQILHDVAAEMAPVSAQRLYQLSERRGTLTPPEAVEMANLLLPFYRSAADAVQGEVGEPAPPIEPQDILNIWRTTSPKISPPSGKAGFAPDNRSAAPSQPVAAGGPLTWLDPRWAVRVASVLHMKDRAGVVGAQGVGPGLIQKLLASPGPRIHLIGHSYGAKVILSALCCGKPARPAATLLLLEPAVSYLCFGENLGGTKRRGGYRDALDCVAAPVFSTFSAADAPLTKFFHMAVIRDSDWGEQKVAAGPPNRFAALGGFGPGGLAGGESRTLDMLPPDDLYPQQQGIRVFGLDGSRGQIQGHGDVTTNFTAWAHLNLVLAAERSTPPTSPPPEGA